MLITDPWIKGETIVHTINTMPWHEAAAGVTPENVDPDELIGLKKRGDPEWEFLILSDRQGAQPMGAWPSWTIIMSATQTRAHLLGVRSVFFSLVVFMIFMGPLRQREGFLALREGWKRFLEDFLEGFLSKNL